MHTLTSDHKKGLIGQSNMSLDDVFSPISPEPINMASLPARAALSHVSRASVQLNRSRFKTMSTTTSQGTRSNRLVSRSKSFSEDIPEAHMTCSNLSYTLPVQQTRYLVIRKTIQKTILKDVYCTIPRNKLTAIIGPSGSGKTSLLNVISGRNRFSHVGGTVDLDGTKLTDNNRLALRNIVGYVAQDDIIMGSLTVRENIRFSANLRLPKVTTEEYRNQRVEELIIRLGLTRCADRRIGTTEQRGVSGGERKRCAIGMEMVAKPTILFLDEPTTGLDASTSLSVIKLCKELSETQTIVSVIHQPRSTLWSLYDWAIIMSKGTAVYQGDSTLHTLLVGTLNHLGAACEEFECPADHVLDVLQSKDEVHSICAKNHKDKYKPKSSDKKGWRKEKVRSKKHFMSHDISKVQLMRTERPLDKQLITPQDMPSSMTKLRTLCKRSITDYYRNPANLNINVLVQFAVAIVFGLLFLSPKGAWALDDLQEQQSRIGLLFAMIFGIWHTTIIAVDQFQEGTILFYREVQAGYYTAGPYFISKFVCELIPNRVVPIIFYTCITYWMSGLHKDFTTWLLCVLPLTNLAMCSGALILLYCALSNDIRVVINSFIITTLFSLFATGLSPSISQLPIIIRWFQWISIPRYTLINLLISEFSALPDSNATTTQQRNEAVAKIFVIEDFSMRTYWMNYGIVWGITVVVIFSSYAIIALKTRHM